MGAGGWQSRPPQSGRYFVRSTSFSEGDRRRGALEGRNVSATVHTIRVGLVDDHAIERQGLRALIEAESDMQVVAEAPNGLEALRLIGRAKPHVVITETIMPHMNGLELTGQLLKSDPDVKVIALTRNERRDCVLRLVQAGACGYLLKTVSSAELVAAIRTVCDGGRVLQPPALDAVLQDYLLRCHEPSGTISFAELTAREREVIKLVADGHSSQEIAVLLRLSRKTVETHRRNIMDKLGVHKVTDLVKYAVREGLVALD